MSESVRKRHPSTVSTGKHPDCDYVVKTILLGDIGVGKTSLLHTFLHGKPPSRGKSPSLGKPPPHGKLCHETASGDKVIQYHGKNVMLSMWDTAGQERYRSLTASYYRGAHACIIMYDVNNEESFDHVITWMEAVREYSDPHINVNIVIVGNRSRGDNPANLTQRRSSPTLHSHQQQQQHPRTSSTESDASLKRAYSVQPQGGDGGNTSQHRTHHHKHQQEQSQHKHQQPQRGKSQNIMSQPGGRERGGDNSDPHRHSQQPDIRVVDRQRAENLAAHLEVPHFELDLQSDPQELTVLMNTVVAMVMTRAMQGDIFYTSNPAYIPIQLPGSHKTKQSKCSACCGQ